MRHLVVFVKQHARFTSGHAVEKYPGQLRHIARRATATGRVLGQAKETVPYLLPLSGQVVLFGVVKRKAEVHEYRPRDIAIPQDDVRRLDVTMYNGVRVTPVQNGAEFAPTRQSSV